jgi:hypothetical protein
MQTLSRFIIKDPKPGCVQGKCGVCGVESDRQHSRDLVLKKTSANLTVMFPFNTDSICEHCIVMWDAGAANPWNRALLAIPGKVFFPVISDNPDVVTEERPTWGSALRRLDPDLPRIAILTTDPKKRNWPRARISQGDRFDVLIHDGARCISDVRIMSLSRLIETLDFVEMVYNLGFSKTAIENGLMGVQKAVQKVGFKKTVDLEAELKELRRHPELVMASMVARQHRRFCNPRAYR